MNTRASMVLSLGLVLTFSAGAAEAHIRLDSPTPRYDYTDTGIKFAPCASGSATGVVTHLQPGQPLTVMWTETVSHPGFFRISLDTSGNDAFPAISPTPQSPVTAPVLADDILPHEAGTAPIARMFTVTLPNVSCAKCTLQLTQFMSDNPTSGYYECADVTLGTDVGTLGGAKVQSGCSYAGARSGGGGSPVAALALMALGLASRRRRSKIRS
jgi:MYXO-CTERM domain-containing protein